MVVERARITRFKEDGRAFKERDLEGHLRNGNQPEEQPASAVGKKSKTDEIDGDYQLLEALNLLKGLSILTAPAKGG